MSLMARLLYRGAGRLPASVKRAIVQLREDKFLVGVVGIVLNERDEILLFRHSYRPFAPWGLPSGWLHAGESLTDTLQHEVEEEASLAIEVEEVLSVETAGNPVRIDVWLKCRSAGGTARASAEVEEAAFALDAVPPLMKSQEAFLTRHRSRLLRSAGS